MQELIHSLVVAGLALLILALGLEAGLQDALHVLKRPALLLRALLAVVVIVPLFALVQVNLLALSRDVALAILLMSISPFPPFVPTAQLKLGGGKAYSIGLLLAMSLFSVLTVPLSVNLMAHFFKIDVTLSLASVARTIFISVLAPMGLGMLLHRFAPLLAQRIAPWLSRLANLLLIVGLAPLLFALWPAIARLIGNGSVLAMAAVVLVGLTAGHALGGPAPGQRAALAIAAATRHPGLALLVAGAIGAGKDVKAAILLFVLVGLLTELPYRYWVLHRQAQAGSRERSMKT